MDPSTTSVIRDIFLIVAAGLVAALCLVFIVIIVKLYRPIKETVGNSRQATGNLNRITTDFSKISHETSENIVQASRNIVDITNKARDTTEELAPAVHSLREAASGIASAATTVTRVAEMIGRLIPQNASGSGASSGVGALLRLVRSMFGGNRRSDESGAQQES